MPTPELPYSPDAESSVLGGILLSPQSLQSVTDILDADDFYATRHRLIFQAIQSFDADEKPFDAVTLGEHFESSGQAESIGGSHYLIELASGTPSAANVAAYAAIVREKSVLRQIIQAGNDIVSAGFSSSGETPADAYALAVSRITALQPKLSFANLPPVDLFEDATTPDIRADWIPPAISDLIFESSAVKGCPPEVMFLSMLISCSAACHDKFCIQPKANEPGWRESARLWGMIIGDPSVKKTPAMKLALAPLSERNFKLVQKHGDLARDYDVAMKQYNADEKIRTRAAAKGDGLSEPGKSPQRPQQSRIIVNDATIEKLADLLADNSRGMFYVNDELAGFFASMDAYSKNAGGRDRSYWLKFYDGGSHIVDRMSRAPTIVENGSMRILGAIQPDRIRTLAATMDDDGLLQRFIVAVIKPGQRPASDAPEPTELIQRYKALLDHLWNTTPEGLSVVQMSPEALTIQAELNRYVAGLVESEGLPSMLRSHLSKWPGLFPRLCLTYHMIGCAAQGIYPTTLALTGSTARRVDSLMRRWILPNAMAFYTGLAGQSSPSFDLAKQIGNAILGAGLGRVSQRDLTLRVTAWRSAPKWKQDQAISMLEQAGWLLPSGIDRANGKTAPAWPVNPRVHIDFAARAAKVAADRATGRTLLADMKQARREERAQILAVAQTG